jgi:hypothetical protein
VGLGVLPPVYLGEDLNVIEQQPYPWQTQILKIIEAKPSERKIYWIFDPLGNTGKSKLTKYLIFKEKALMLGWAAQKDLFYARAQNTQFNTIIFDFTRSGPESANIYEIFSSIETIKNAALFTSKWESGHVITKTPHIICFSNFLPTQPKYLSSDRWELYRVGKETKTLIPMDNEQANDFIIDYVKFEKDLRDQKELKEKNKKEDSFKSSVYKGLFSTKENSWDYYKPSETLLKKYGN